MAGASMPVEFGEDALAAFGEGGLADRCTLLLAKSMKSPGTWIPLVKCTLTRVTKKPTGLGVTGGFWTNTMSGTCVGAKGSNVSVDRAPNFSWTPEKKAGESVDITVAFPPQCWSRGGVKLRWSP